VSRSTDARQVVREHYANAAKQATEGSFAEAKAAEAPGCGPPASSFGDVLYEIDQAEGATEAALSASRGCGVPTAVADLSAGEGPR